MIINNKRYKVQDAYNDVLSIPDCWVCDSNKVGKGHGEGKFYYGAKSKLQDIFPGNNSSVSCFVLKSDLLVLLETLRIEYERPRDKYRGMKDFKKIYETRLRLVQALPDTPIEFEVNYQRQITGTRGYINTSAEIYRLLRQIALPNLCFLSIMRLVNVNDERDIKFYWKVYADVKLLYSKNRKEAYAHRYGLGPQSQSKQERTGQQAYRNKLIREFGGQCAVTKADLPEVLIASHIKPYRVANATEKTDANNGILLSANFDKLFDKGYITFNSDGKVVVSTWLTSENCNKLNVVDNTQATIHQNPAREDYLKYHRQFIFKGKIE